MGKVPVILTLIEPPVPAAEAPPGAEAAGAALSLDLVPAAPPETGLSKPLDGGATSSGALGGASISTLVSI